MKVMIAMLRGVNVGGHNRIKMDALRKMCGNLGLIDACTYVQSGNVVFRTKERTEQPLAKRIEDGIETSFGFRPDVVLRTADAMAEVVARNPFAKRKGLDPAKLLVTFFAAEPEAEARAAVLEIDAGPEELQFAGRELYTYFPNGAGKSKFPWARVAKLLKTAGTARNWNTVTTLLEMAGDLTGPKSHASP